MTRDPEKYTWLPPQKPLNWARPWNWKRLRMFIGAAIVGLAFWLCVFHFAGVL